MSDQPKWDWMPLLLLIVVAVVGIALWRVFPYVYAYAARIDCIAVGRTDCLPH